MSVDRKREVALISEHADQNTSGHTQIRRCSAKEALQHDLRKLVVPEGKTILVSPKSPEFIDHFVAVSLTSFDDLQTLGFVPRGIAQETLRKAIVEDDNEGYRMAQTMFTQGRHECVCGEQGWTRRDCLATSHHLNMSNSAKHCEGPITQSVGVTTAMRLRSSRSSIAFQSRGTALWSRLLCVGQDKLILCESIRSLCCSLKTSSLTATRY